MPMNLKATLDYEVDTVWVTWDAEDVSFTRYEVRISDLRACTHNIREHLKKLQKLDLPNDRSDYDFYQPILGPLAHEGARLYDVLMSGNPDDPLSAVDAAEFREWFEDTVIGDDASWHIHVVHPENASFVVPWGLIFTPPPDGDIDSLDPGPDGLSRFWSIVHRSSCSVVTPPDEIEPDKKGRPNVILSAFMEGDHHLTSHKIEQITEPDIRERLDEVISDTPDAAQDRVNEFNAYDQFWYLWLNPDGGGNAGSLQKIDAEHFENALKNGEDKLDRVVFLLLDGDAVIRQDRGVSWLSAALKFGRSGLIAVEADIDNEKLRCFGWSILRHILTSRRPFTEAITEARRALWPHSLLYGVYCNPSDAYSDPPDRETIAAMDRYMRAMNFEVHEWGENQ